MRNSQPEFDHEPPKPVELDPKSRHLGLDYRGSALNHPDSTPEFKNRTHKRRAKNKVAKQSRKRNR